MNIIQSYLNWKAHMAAYWATHPGMYIAVTVGVAFLYLILMILKKKK